MLSVYKDHDVYEAKSQIRISKWKVLGLFPWVATARQEALLSLRGKAGLLKCFLTCYIKNYNFLNSGLPSLNQNSDQQKLHKCYFKNLGVTKCLLTYTHFPRNSLFFGICKAACKIGLFAFDEPLIFSPCFHFPLILPFLPVTATYTRRATKPSQQCHCERSSEGATVSESGTGLSTPVLFSKSSLPSYYHVSIQFPVSVCWCRTYEFGKLPAGVLFRYDIFYFHCRNAWFPHDVFS